MVRLLIDAAPFTLQVAETNGVVFKKVDTDVELKFAERTSGLPSLFISAVTAVYGVVPEVRSIRVAKLGVLEPANVVFKNTAILLVPVLAAAISGLPSLLKSATERPRGVEPVPAARSVLDEKLAVDEPVVVEFRYTETLSPFVTTISGLPSLLKSPALTESGEAVVAILVLTNDADDAPVVVAFRNTETLLEPLFATAMSGLPSPL